MIFKPEIIRLKGINKAIKPKDWKKISEVKLPRNPSIFWISTSFGKIKFGSSGEKVTNEASNRVPVIKIVMPIISITLFKQKFIALWANIFNFINNESN